VTAACRDAASGGVVTTCQTTDLQCVNVLGGGWTGACCISNPCPTGDEKS
jgi:hypothetical protein